MIDAERPLYEFLKEVARDRGYVDSDISLNRIDSGGANYTSKLFTTTLSAPGTTDLPLFCKVASMGKEMRSRVKEFSIFTTEIMFYTKILPKYRELEKIHNVPTGERLIVPEFYGGSTKYMEELLVLEDLSTKGYQCMNRFDCVDWKYASRCVSVLARFHALSVAFEKVDPVTYSNLIYKPSAMKFELPASQDYLEKGIQNTIKITDIKYRLRVENLLRNDLREQSFRKFSLQERRPLLCHGDFRPNNILHKIDKDGNLRVVLTDYQIIRRWNPVAELMFFLVCGSDEQFRAEHLHKLFDHYYETLGIALRQLSIEPHEVYSERDFREDIEKILPSGLILGIYVLPFITADEETVPKPDDCIDIVTFDLQPGVRYQERFNGLVKTFDKLGII